MNDWTAAPASSSTDSTDDPLMRRARQRVELKVGFFVHALVFTLVNLGLFTFNQAIGGHRWSLFPMWGWAIGLTIHGVITFLKLAGEGWRERMLNAELARLRG